MLGILASKKYGTFLTDRVYERNGGGRVYAARYYIFLSRPSELDDVKEVFNIYVDHLTPDLLPPPFPHDPPPKVAKPRRAPLVSPPPSPYRMKTRSQTKHTIQDYFKAKDLLLMTRTETRKNLDHTV